MDGMLGQAMDSAIAANAGNDWHQFPLPMAVERLISQSIIISLHRDRRLQVTG